MNRRILAITAAVVLAISAGCGSAPRPLPGAHQSAHDLNIAGNKAYGAGKLEKALGLYEEARRTCISIDDGEGAAMNQFNVAATLRRLGDDRAALDALDEILEGEAYIGAGPGIRAKAAYMRGVVRVSAGDTKQAAGDAELAAGMCAGAEDCALAGKILNLKARIALAEGKYNDALGTAAEALKENESLGDAAEAANSHRIIADAKSFLGDLDTALTEYQTALATDKELGLPDKVGRDIESIGMTLCRSGRHIEARDYFKRACTAYLNAGEEAGYENSAELLNVCYTHPDK